MKRNEIVTAARAARSQKVIVERREHCGASEWWAMFTDGSVQVFDTASAALREIKKHARRGNRGVTITHIEWRGVSADWAPPVL